MYTDADCVKAIHAESKRLEQFLSDLSPEDQRLAPAPYPWRAARGLPADVTG